ncbi:MAG: phospholipid/glycerol acyltransferase [Acidobacteria bacterium]|nr:phospholipid/glycerol acyltransferase [Acidobacteriota bacterium]
MTAWSRGGQTRREKVSRRLRTIPAMVVGFILTTALLPVLLLGLGAYDLVRAIGGRGRFSAVRLVAFGWVYMLVDVIGITSMLVFWLVSGFGRRRERYVSLTYGLQGWWASALLGAMRFIFRVGLEVEGDDITVPGPIILMMRHASLADTVLPSVLVLRRHGLRLRYVLKRELLWDPALDLAGNAMPNYFLDRRSTDPAAEVEHVRELGVDLGENDGVLIYPEGTRFTPEKRERALEILRRRFPHLVERAEALRGVLAPRLAGVLALLEAGTDVVVCAHVGFDGLSHVKRLWRGGLVGVKIKVAFWRIPAGEIPAGESERTDWLFAQWRVVDDWVLSHLSPA